MADGRLPNEKRPGVNPGALVTIPSKRVSRRNTHPSIAALLVARCARNAFPELWPPRIYRLAGGSLKPQGAFAATGARVKGNPAAVMDFAPRLWLSCNK